jgi:hypothetical protein
LSFLDKDRDPLQAKGGLASIFVHRGDGGKSKAFSLPAASVLAISCSTGFFDSDLVVQTNDQSVIDIQPESELSHSRAVNTLAKCPK